MADAPEGWVGLEVDLTGVTDKAGLLDGFAAAGRFPDWSGANWDALQDLLRDLSWLGPANGYVLVLEGWEPFAAAAPGDAAVADEVLAEAARRWSASGIPFVIVR